MDIAPSIPWTVESFVAWEDQQDGKHEFDGQRVVAMTGGSRAHQRIIFNLLTLLMGRVSSGFDVVQEMRVRIGARVRYPDVCVCAGLIPPATRTLTDAVAIFEVLSAETASTDRQTKLAEYAELPGILCYVLLEQSRIGVTVHRRRGGRWETQLPANGVLPLPDIGTAVPVGAIHAGVRLATNGGPR
jgi:Uma2 family endonuclease